MIRATSDGDVVCRLSSLRLVEFFVLARTHGNTHVSTSVRTSSGTRLEAVSLCLKAT